MKQLSLYEIIMLTHSSFQFNICTAHVNPPIDMFVRNANITMGRRVERINSRTEKNQVRVCLRLKCTTLDIFHLQIFQNYLLFT